MQPAINFKSFQSAFCITDALVNSCWQSDSRKLLQEEGWRERERERKEAFHLFWPLVTCTILLPSVKEPHCIIVIHSWHTVNGKEEREGEEAFTLKDVYSNLFYFVRYDSFLYKCTGPKVQGLRVVDIRAMTTLHINMTSHSVCVCIFELCACTILIFSIIHNQPSCQTICTFYIKSK